MENSQFMPSSRQLQGLSLDVAECYGKPHINAHYTADNVDKYIHEGACALCGGRATNAHHQPPKGRGRNFLLLTDWGQFVLKPSLIALCGSGTTGCHGRVHNRQVLIKWVWRDEEYQRQWWSGEILKNYAPHSKELYNFGYWVIGNKKIETDLSTMN